MSGGTARPQRLPEGLASDRFRVDETTIPEQLAMTRRLAGALGFVAEDNLIHGDWGQLLDHDESVLLALCQAFRPHRKVMRFLDDYHAAQPGLLADEVRDLVGWIDGWITHLAVVDRPWTRAFRERVLQVLREFLPAELKKTGDFEPGEIAAAVELRLGAIERKRGGQDMGEADTLSALRRLFFSLIRALERLQVLAAQAWDDWLATERHEPAASLLIAFMYMFERVQQHVNGFTERLTSFYYDDVLRMPPRPVTPDSVLLAFQRDPAYAGRALVPAGARFVLPGASGAAIEFAADNALAVTDVRVEHLCTLRLQRDGLISPEREFGYVTRVKVDHLRTMAVSDLTRARASPLLGADVRGAMRKGQNGRLGFAVSSPVLWLKEGERDIRLTISFDFDPEKVEDLISALMVAKTRTEAARPLGRLFAHWVLPDISGLTDGELEAIRKKARSLPGLARYAGDRAHDVVMGKVTGQSPTDPLLLFLAPDAGDAEDRRTLIRDELIENLFQIELSTAAGWHGIDRAALVSEADARAGAMTLAVRLSQEDPAVTACESALHGAEWPIEAPTLRLVFNEKAGLYPLSLLEGAIMRAVDLAVEVRGLRDLRAYNQLGPLDPSRPFMPFGPLPNTASYFVIGAPELARKHVTRLTVRPDWVGLPSEGFSLRYEGYGARISDDSFTVRPEIMRDGLWPDVEPGRVPLFEAGEHGPIGLPVRFDPAALRARWRPTEDELILDQNARNGFVRLRLASPEQGFGHQAYPEALTEALSARARGRKRHVLPSPPYTPLVERVVIHYAASAHIPLGETAGVGTGPERLMHLRPFGVQEIRPAAGEPCALVPRFDRDGNLYIGLSGGHIEGPVTLMFDLRKDTAIDTDARRNPRPVLEWSWLGEDGWTRFEDGRLLSDSTEGFLTSGVVTLDLPPGMTRGASIMPGDLCWLRLSSNEPSGCFAGLKGVTTQALSATRVVRDVPPAEPLPANSIGLANAAFPGIIGIGQPESGFGLRRAETQAETRTRIGERLRHKNRASTPWDYERLVLERFPSVYKARCLANQGDEVGKVEPGKVLVVVAPGAHRNDLRYASRPMRLDPLELDRIQDYLRDRASPAAEVHVRNAGFDLIQVRGKVVLRRTADLDDPALRVDLGDTLRAINSAILTHVSPWYDGGCDLRFDWDVRSERIEDCIRAVPGVDSVTDITLIRVSEDKLVDNDHRYGFEDTAFEAEEHATLVQALHPWSLALPAPEHFITVVPQPDSEKPPHTGLARETMGAGIQIGSTFIVGRRKEDAK